MNTSAPRESPAPSKGTAVLVRNGAVNQCVASSRATVLRVRGSEVLYVFPCNKRVDSSKSGGNWNPSPRLSSPPGSPRHVPSPEFRPHPTCLKPGLRLRTASAVCPGHRALPLSVLRDSHL